MRQSLQTLAKLAFSRAIAEKAIDALDTDKTTEYRLYRDMADAAMAALQTWPDRVRKADIRAINDRLGDFCELSGWDDKKSLNIQTHLNFSLELLERLKDELSDKTRINALNRLIDAHMAVYNHFAKREYPLCLAAGLRAAETWNRVMEG